MLALQPPLHAEARPRPFETIRIELSAVTSTNRNDFHEHWDPGVGIEALAEMPFHLGVVQAGAQYNPNESRQPDIPDFTALFTYLGWGMDLRLPRRFSLLSGVRTGVLWMDFDSLVEADSGTDENELGFSWHSSLRYRIDGSWSVNLTGRYRVVLTHKRLKQAFVSLGIGRSFATPRWLQEFLQ
jgi:hypothetical protein